MKKKIFAVSLVLCSAALLNFIFPMKNNADDEENITINEPIELNYKTKEEIYNIRKSYVEQSIFADSNYQPSEEVFGGIEDSKPWIALNDCVDYSTNYHANIEGPSMHSKSLINPSLPVMIDYPFYISTSPEDKYLCVQIPKIMVPLSAKYSKENKEVEITYRTLLQLRGGAYQFTAVNAKDFGYNYIYLDKSKSTYKVDFVTNDNLSTSVKDISDFIHLGNACRIEGGCNNWSRNREDFQFKPSSLAAGVATPSLYFKLWKTMPSSPQDEADLNVKINFNQINSY